MGREDLRGRQVGGRWCRVGAGARARDGRRPGQHGVAGPDDVRGAAAFAVTAQREWAARPHTERAAVLRRAGDLFQQHAAEIVEWNIREVGAIRPIAEFAVGVAVQECYEASALPSRPYGELIPSDQPRLSIGRRVPAGVVAVISPFNVPIILGDPFGRARRSRSATPCCSSPTRAPPSSAASSSPGSSRRPACRPGVLQVLPGGADVGEALITAPHGAGRLVHRLHGRGPPHRGAGGPAPQAGPPGARRQLRPRRAGGRRRRPGGEPRRLGVVPAPGPDLHDHRPAHRARRDLRGVRGEARRHGRRRCPSATRSATGRPRSGHRRRPARQDPRAWWRPAARAARRSRPAGSTTASSTGRRSWPTSPIDSPAFAEEIFGPVAPVTRYVTDEEALAIAADTPYGLSLGIVTPDVMRGLALAERIPTGIVHINDQTVNDEANIPFGGVGSSGTGSRFGGAAANVDAFTETQWVTLRSEPPRYPF